MVCARPRRSSAVAVLVARDDGEGERRVAAAPADRVGGRAAAGGRADAGRPRRTAGWRPRSRWSSRRPFAADAGSVARHGGARGPRGLARAVAAGAAVPGRRVVRHARGGRRGSASRRRSCSCVVALARRYGRSASTIELGAAWGWSLILLMLLGPVLLPWYVAWSLPLVWLLPRVPRAVLIGHRCGAHAVAMDDRAHAVPRRVRRQRADRALRADAARAGGGGVATRSTSVGGSGGDCRSAPRTSRHTYPPPPARTETAVGPTASVERHAGPLQRDRAPRSSPRGRTPARARRRRWRPSPSAPSRSRPATGAPAPRSTPRRCRPATRARSGSLRLGGRGRRRARQPHVRRDLLGRPDRSPLVRREVGAELRDDAPVRRPGPRRRGSRGPSPRSRRARSGAERLPRRRRIGRRATNTSAALPGGTAARITFAVGRGAGTSPRRRTGRRRTTIGVPAGAAATYRLRTSSWRVCVSSMNGSWRCQAMNDPAAMAMTSEAAPGRREPGPDARAGEPSVQPHRAEPRQDRHRVAERDQPVRREAAR